ncbi:hypothetical protein MMC13_002898 [Lambiella insularis]|nr:hypothetical protein [Lambiella insularis]
MALQASLEVVDLAEVLFAALTIYHMRIIERIWGSRKFASFLFTLYPSTSLLPPLILALILRPLSLNIINYLPSGPTPLIFALLAQYHATVPHVYKYRVATSTLTSSASCPDGILLSDKSITYLLASQLAFSQLPGSLLAASIGWGIGIAWRSDILPEKFMGWRLPTWIIGGRREGEGFEGLRRRLEGEGRASGVEGPNSADDAGRQRRGMGRAILDQFRGAF